MKKKLLFIFLTCMPASLLAFDFQGEVGAELRTFFQKGVEQQARNHPSAYIQPEWHFDVNQKRDLFKAELFYRVDARDTQRTHGDIRALNWIHVGENWETLVGIGKVFWGVTETRHLVDIINQTDLVENIDAEDKLGQPMLRGTWITDEMGTFTGFILPYFRERPFPGQKGRLRTNPRVHEDLAYYESSKRKRHLDWALRWSHVISLWDIGLSVFHGTAREPMLMPSRIGSTPFIAPFYPLITQWGLDLQATVGDWLWKFEGIINQNDYDDYQALVGGFEYTMVGVLDSQMDLGLLAEYHYDSRNRLSPQPFNDDVALGFRLSFNDIQSMELLAFVMFDRHHASRIFRVEGRRRIGEAFTISLESSLFDNIAPTDPAYSFRQDDFVQLNLAYHF